MINVTISDLYSADNILKTGNYDALLSIGMPDGKRFCSESAPNTLRIGIYDVTPTVIDRKTKKWRLNDLPPTDDIIRIVDWGKALTDEMVLVHCHRGKSRSTAAGLIICVASGMSENEAVEHIHKNRKQATPNWYILAVADQLMNTNILGEWKNRGYNVKRCRTSKEPYIFIK